MLVVLYLGVGRALEYKMASFGVKTCGELQQILMARLQKEFGPKTGQMLYRFCRGLDDRPVRTEKERKSVSAEINYGIRFSQVSYLLIFLRTCNLLFILIASFFTSDPELYANQMICINFWSL